MRSINNYGRKCFSVSFAHSQYVEIVVIQFCEAWLNDI